MIGHQLASIIRFILSHSTRWLVRSTRRALAQAACSNVWSPNFELTEVTSAAWVKMLEMLETRWDQKSHCGNWQSLMVIHLQGKHLSLTTFKWTQIESQFETFKCPKMPKIFAFLIASLPWTALPSSLYSVYTVSWLYAVPSLCRSVLPHLQSVAGCLSAHLPNWASPANRKPISS